MCETKKCYKCGLTLSLDNFHKDKTRKDRLSSKCKKCSYEGIKKWRIDNPEKVRNQKIRGQQNLNNDYVKKTLTVCNKNLNYKDISPELVELQRESIKLKRKIKEINKQINN